MLLGSHVSIAGGMHHALLAATRQRMDCVQVFTKNQRQWKTSPLQNETRDLWLAALRSMAWNATAQLGSNLETQRVVSHNSYLINLASPSDELWKKSIDSQRVELERCEELKIGLCVAHPGAHLLSVRPRDGANELDRQPQKDELKGLKRIIKALDALHQNLPGYRVQTCLETTVGSGSNLGYCFHHLAFIRANVKQPERVGFCFDTCHVTAAGYDMTSEAKSQGVLQQWDEICGLEHIRAFHLNDSKGAVGSRLDRHAHIGDGRCGRACFRVILNHPAFAHVPMILETPKEKNEKGEDWDVVNLRRLRRLAKEPFRKARKQSRPKS